MRSSYFLPVLFMFFSFASFAQNENKDNDYKFTIDLVNVKNDKVNVELITPAISAGSITYHLPKIVPGTYSVDDYGRYVEDFKAFDKKGDTLHVTHPDVDSWTISNAEKLYRISYWVNDSYDDFTTKQVIFEPAGSNIQKDTDYVINNHCFLGYFDNMKNVTYEVNIKHPATMYGSTALTDVDNSNTSDKFITESYNRIVDNPFLYDVPDTAVIKVGKTDVLISVYSPNKKVSAKFLAQKLDTLLKAQTKYLGGKLPVDKYAFIIFLDDKQGPSGSEGALEHSYCSFYYLPETDENDLAHEFVDDAAHEFFHILTPLSIHAEQIQNFDFNDPKMSEHLWLYEGSTEYHAHMVQEKYGLITPDELLKTLSDKITNSRNNYNDTVPFTILSSQTLGAYKKQYGNVYQKGALIAMCIDIKLLQLSNGKYGFINLIHDLSNTYGKQKGFKDEELFDVIGKLTYPEIETFLNTYVGGNQPLPLEQIFDLVGVSFIPKVETKDSTFSLGHISLGFDGAAGRLTVEDTTDMNTLGRALAYHVHDDILSINGTDILPQSARNFLGSFGKHSNPGDPMVVKVMRKDAAGKADTLELKSVMTKFPKINHNVLTFMTDATPAQLMLRDAWLKPNGLQIK
jgi:predicted metalloprotease with PDZ domain